MYSSLKTSLCIQLAFLSLCSCADTVSEGDNEVIILNINPYLAGTDALPSSPENMNMEEGVTPQAGTMSAGTMSLDTMAGSDMMAGTELVATIAGSDTMAGTQVSSDPPPNEFPDFAVEMLEYVNQFRSTGGTCGSRTLPSSAPLRLNALLNQAAQDHAEDMAQNNYFDHNSQDGRSPWDRVSATGYQGSGFGENIAAGRGDVQSTFIQWQNSPGHCQNMLNGNYNELGVGYANAPASRFRHYWVQNFARSR